MARPQSVLCSEVLLYLIVSPENLPDKCLHALEVTLWLLITPSVCIYLLLPC